MKLKMNKQMAAIEHSIAQAIEFGLVAPERAEDFRRFAQAQAANLIVILGEIEEQEAEAELVSCSNKEPYWV